MTMILRPRFQIRAAASNARRVASWLSVRNEDDPSKPIELLIYDQIGRDWFDQSGVDAKTFAETLQGIPAHRDILVAINSPGGNVWDGLAIYHQLQNRRDRVTTRVDGIAASIASVIALAGRETRMPKNALMMIHDPSGLVIGTAADMRDVADELDKHADVLADIYATKSGTAAGTWRRRMGDETWYTGAEARDAGLADTVTDEVQLTARFDLSRCRRVPAALKHRSQPIPQMNKALILALLRQHGIQIADTASDETLLAELNKLVRAGKVTEEQRNNLVNVAAAAPPAPAPAPAPAAQPPAPQPQAAGAAAQANAGQGAAAPPALAAPQAAATLIDPARLDELQRQIRVERERRITAEFDQVIAVNPAIDRAAWLPRVLADETIMAQLRALPRPQAGVDPIRASLVNCGNPLLEEYSRQAHGAQRQAYRLQRFEAIQRARREFQPRAVNTLDAALVTDWLADGLIVVANNKLAALAAFSTDFGIDRLKPRATVQVRKATGTSAAQTNPSNFETGDTTVDNIPVSVSQISKSFHLTNDELNSGHRLAHLAQINAQTFANAISDVWTALILAATFAAPAPANIGAAGAFDAGVLADIYGFAKNFRMKNLILDGAYIGRLIPVNSFSFSMQNGGFRGAYGFDLITEQNRWTGATANTIGVVCGPDAIAVGSGLPIEQPQGEFLSLATETLEPIGLTIQMATWYSRAGRVIWASYDVMFGAAAGDTTQLNLLKSA